MSMDNKVPEIRFKEFSGEWAEKTLGAVAEIKTGPFGSTLHAKAYVEDGHAIITTEHFKSGELPVDKKGIPQVSDDDYLRLKAYLLKVGDIVFSRVGSVDINAHITNKQEGWLFSGRVLRVRTEKIIDSEYLHHELSTSRVKKSVVSRAVGQTMPSINTEILKITPIHFSLDTTEQIAIGNYFQKLDSLINQHQQKHDKLSNIKKAMLEKMFPKQDETIPKIRFKGFSGEWQEREFSDIATRVSTHHQSTCLPCVEYEDIVAGKGRLNKDIHKKKTFKSGLKFEADDVLFGKLRPYLKNWFLADFEGLAVGDFWVLRANNVASTFLFSLIQTNEFELISNLSAGSKMPRSDWGLVSSSCFFVPKNISESNEIGNYFQKLDSLINLHQQQITKLNNIKQSCLSKMFV